MRIRKSSLIQHSNNGTRLNSQKMIEAMRYKLRVFGIPIDGPANVFCDNTSVVTNSTVPDSTLKKKHNAIAYHRVWEAVAAGTIWIANGSIPRVIMQIC